MKKTLILVLAAVAMLLAGANASAQVSIGAGPATRIYFDKGADPYYAVGVQLNFEDSMRLSDVFAYSAGIDFGTYRKKGYMLSSTNLTEMYVDLPVRAKFYIPCGGGFDLFFFGGVVPSVCLSSNVRLESDKVSRFGENSNYSRYDVMAGGGIGAEIAERFKIALGYDHGLLNRYKETGTLHTAAAKFTVSFLF